MAKRCIIVSAGPVEPEQASLATPEDFILACDAGWHNCETLGLCPALVVGDFDSSAQPQAGGEILVLPHEKDDTDTHYAAREAVRRGYTEVLMLGALGGRRMEHTLANLATALWLEKQGVRVTLADARSRVSFVAPGACRAYRKGPYFYISVFPAEGTAQGVTIEGAHYPLHAACLTTEYPVGVSNEYAGGVVTISVKSGFLMIIETLADV